MPNGNNQLQWIKGDLHVHSVLSPCGELEMSPSNVMNKCKELGIDILGICDHNSGANLPAFIKKAEEENIMILCGMEVQTREEVHLLCFFPCYNNLMEFEEEFKGTLPKINNNPEVFGDQVIIDENEQILHFEDNLLLISSSLGIGDVIKLTQKYNGEVIAAHIDKKYYSLISNLGFLPSYNFLAVEIFNYDGKEKMIHEYSEIENYPIIVSSDAHKLDDMDQKYQTYFFVKELTWQELLLAFQNKDSRKIAVYKNDTVNQE
ncbi:PHP domain-containing protein [Natranaerofaba carboxydovora]|uniref:PHP domain-containing protein n=1 Tax=Natranaerofaba carboxydovora TaxID=2742683 RepID=UPI001F149135|nr:PHP domain-containing protein [Natranaerofaba carboxydovora]UMZ75296.1 PHP domain protein [Natranaerofaba carboxydovora]